LVFLRLFLSLAKKWQIPNLNQISFILLKYMMEKQLTQGKQCNYQVTFTFTDAEKAGVKNHVLEHFAKDMKKRQ